MIADNIKNIFTFLEFLNSNIKNLNNQKPLLDEIERVRTKYNDLDPKIDFRDKFERDELEIKGNSLIENFKKECKNAINEKIVELDITDLNNLGNNHFHHIGELIILIHTQKYDLNDVDLILKAKCNYIAILEHLEVKLENFIPYDLVRDFREDILDCFKPFLSVEDKIIIEKKQFLFSSDNWFVLGKLDKENLEKAVRKLTGNSNNLHFETFPEFLDYLKKEVKDLDFDERHSEVKRMLEQQKIKLENSTFQSEIDEVKIFSENAIKDSKSRLQLTFTNENYKTKVNGSFNPQILNVAKALFEYEKLYQLAETKVLPKALPPQQMEVKNSNIKPTITINSEAKETVFSILKDFFETEQQDEFKEVLATFGTVKNKLIFKSYSNQFTDTFKKLFENNFILGCQKTDLINWIVSNFNFMYRKEVKEFKTKTVEQIISGNQTPCKSPIIEIKNGQILKIDY